MRRSTCRSPGATSSSISASTTATARPDATVYVRTTGLATFHREIIAKAYPFIRPGIERTPWRSRLMQVADPFNNRLRFDDQLAPPDDDG